MSYKITYYRQLSDGTYQAKYAIFKNLFSANQFYNTLAEDETIVNLEMEEI